MAGPIIKNKVATELYLDEEIEFSGTTGESL